jgi:ketosteroid isomerase-like protein
VAPSPGFPNFDNVQRFFMSFSSTDHLGEAASLLSAEVVYTVPGQSPMAGVFHGRADVREHLTKVLGLANGTLDVLKWVDWMVGESHVAALQFAQVQGRGMIYRGHHLYLVQTDSDGLLSDIKMFFEEQEEADRFLSLLVY